MELKLKDGDYVPAAGGGFCTVSGEDALVQRALMRLAAHRGAFLPLPDYGSRLYMLPRIKPGERSAAARQFVAEALEAEPEISVGTVEYLPVQDDKAELRVELVCAGKTTAVTLLL